NLDRGYISEIAVPFLYKFMMPCGYFQVNSKKALTEEDFSALKKAGMNISTVFSNDPKFIKSSEDRIVITDLSMTGLGIIFREKTLIKHFRDNSLILFTVF